MKTAKISRYAWNYILKDMCFHPDDVCVYEETDDNGNYLCVKVSVDGWYRLNWIEVEMYDANDNRLEMDADQYALLTNEIEDILAEMKADAMAEARYEQWLLAR